MTSAMSGSRARRSVRKPTAPSNAVGDELPRDVRCEYPSKFCNNHKVLKSKGGMHRFCEYHRRKANLNQKRWQERRREMREQRELERPKNTGQKTTIDASTPSTPVTETTNVKLTTPLKVPHNTQIKQSSPMDVMEPFPIGQFTSTPTATVVQVPTSTHIFTPAVAGFTVDDDLDMLTTLFFNNDPQAHNAYHNWSDDYVPSLREFGSVIV